MEQTSLCCREEQGGKEAMQAMVHHLPQGEEGLLLSIDYLWSEHEELKELLKDLWLHVCAL